MPGGIIPPDGRTPAPPGVGASARRHDLERPKTPGLSGSDLQYGDVSKLRNAQRVAPTGSTTKQVQQPAAPTGSPAGSASAGPTGAMEIPDPIDFISERAKGTLQDPASRMAERPVDMSAWTPIVNAVANAPQASGLLRHAFLNQFAALANRPYVPDVLAVSMQALDAGVEAGLAGQ